MFTPLVATLIAAFAVQAVPVVLEKDSDIIALSFDHTLKDISGADVVLDQAEFFFRVNPAPDLPPGRGRRRRR